MTTKPAIRDLGVARRQITAAARVAETPAEVAEFFALMGGSTHTRSEQPTHDCAADQEVPS